MEYIRAQREPRVFYLAAGETHGPLRRSERRYDRTSATRSSSSDDARPRALAHRSGGPSFLQSTEPYRDRSIGANRDDRGYRDHGRGRTPDDWTSHGKDVPGADEMPDTSGPRLVCRSRHTESRRGDDYRRLGATMHAELFRRARSDARSTAYRDRVRSRTPDDWTSLCSWSESRSHTRKSAPTAPSQIARRPSQA